MRLRITFTKQDALRYTGHLDLNQVWERTIRRAGLPLAYTQGFHPGPRIQIAAALPLGFGGLAELIDIWVMLEQADLPVVQAALQEAAPPGLTICQVEAAEDSTPPLQTLVAAAEYEVLLLNQQGDTAGKVMAVLAAPTLPRQRRDKPYDLRPLILCLEQMETGLFMRLSARAGATGRPEEVLAELGIPLEEARITRLRLLFEDDVK